MITIKITNAADVVEKQKGWFVANVVGAFMDLDARVEAVVIERLREALARDGVEAVIERERGTV
jgi:DNA-binding response OmpR family regulator